MPVIDPDTDVLVGLRSGDERALRELMARHLNRVHALAARLLGDPALAEDVAQTVFLKTWTMVPTWQPGKAKLLTWMMRVTTNHCFDILKKKSPVFTDTVPDISDSRDLADTGLIHAEQSHRVKAAIEALPDRQRAALVLSYYEEVSQREGAIILGVTEGAYESLLVRARKNLKQRLIADANFKENFVEVM